jgi:hypothetical protein
LSIPDHPGKQFLERIDLSGTEAPEVPIQHANRGGPQLGE